jgi:hypothetical protein
MELTQLRWFRHVVRMGVRDIPKWPGKLEHRGRDPNEDPNRLWKQGCRRFWRKEELNGMELRAIAWDDERWIAHCKPCTPTGRRDLTKWIEGKVVFKILHRMLNWYANPQVTTDLKTPCTKYTWYLTVSNIIIVLSVKHYHNSWRLVLYVFL